MNGGGELVVGGGGGGETVKEELGGWEDLNGEVVVVICWLGMGWFEGRESLTVEAYVEEGWGGTLPKASRLVSLCSVIKRVICFSRRKVGQVDALAGWGWSQLIQYD